MTNGQQQDRLLVYLSRTGLMVWLGWQVGRRIEGGEVDALVSDVLGQNPPVVAEVDLVRSVGGHGVTVSLPRAHH